jgi:hypothetical protein
MSRPGGLAGAAVGLTSYLLARFGAEGVLDLRRPFRLALLLLAAIGCLESGYRSSLIFFGLICLCSFWLEGLWRTRLMPIVAAVGLIAGMLILSQAEKLPLSAQRTLAFLPISIDPVAKQSADESSQWRVEMWKLVLPQVPDYLFKGKGYNLDPNEIFMAGRSAANGFDVSAAGSMVAGDYHNGPLSVIIPFGIYGALAFLWFLGAAISYLYRNFRFGDPSLRKINSLLLASFIAKTISFFVIFGAVSFDLCIFIGLLGLGVSLNGQPGSAATVEDTEKSLNPFPETVY